MRITRNYRNGLMSAMKANENTSLFRKALSRNRNSSRTAAILNGMNKIKSFVNQYNKMLNDLEESGTRADDSLLIQINSLSRSNSQELASTGVTRRSDGTLMIDEKKLAEADVDTLKKVWGSKNSFADRAGQRAGSVEAVAQQNMKALASSNYSNPFSRSNLYANYGTKGNYFNFFR